MAEAYTPNNPHQKTNIWSPIDVAIIKTLLYYQIFNYQPTLDELWKYLIEYPCVSKEKLDQSIQTNPLVTVDRGRYRLPTKHSIHQSSVYSWKLINKAFQMSQRLHRIFPFVHLIAVSGSTAALSANQSSDIDLMVICQSGTRWLTRGSFLSYLSLIKERVNTQHSDISNAGKFCLNLILEDSPDNLTLPSQDLFTAMEIAHLKVIVNRHATFQRFLLNNKWVQAILPNFWHQANRYWELDQIKTNLTHQESGKQSFHSQTQSIWKNVDYLLGKVQQFNYWRKHQSILNLNQPWQIDYRPLVMEKYRNLLQEYQLDD